MFDRVQEFPLNSLFSPLISLFSPLIPLFSQHWQARTTYFYLTCVRAQDLKRPLISLFSPLISMFSLLISLFSSLISLFSQH